MNQQIVTIDKITAAGCQIDTAIELIFRDTDFVSPIVLTYGAWSITKDLLKKNEIEDNARMWMLKEFPKDRDETDREHERRIFKVLDSAWNFFKHANNDPDKLLKIPFDFVEPSLFQAIHDFSLIEKQSDYMNIYQAWFITKNKNFFSELALYHGCLEIFPDLHLLNTGQQKALGLKELLKLS